MIFQMPKLSLGKVLSPLRTPLLRVLCLSLVFLVACEDIANYLDCYIVQFDSKGGSNVRQRLITKNRKMPSVPVPRKPNYRFDGWFRDPAASIPVAFEDEPVSANIKVYAGWTKLHQLQFDSDGGSQVSKQTIANNELAVKPPDPVRDNWAFVGWYHNDKPFDFDANNITGNTTLQAVWTQIFYVVKFNTDNTAKIPSTEPKHQQVSPVREQNIHSGNRATKPALDPTRQETWAATAWPAYKSSSDITIEQRFDGWYRDAARTVPFDFTEPISAHTTIYAKWTPLYPVNFDDGVEATLPSIGFVAGSGLPPEQIIPAGGRATKPTAKPQRSHFTFAEWVTDAPTAFDFTQAITEPLTLYSRWDRNKITVRFDIGNDGDPTLDRTTKPGDKTILSGETIDRPGNPRSGTYNFEGWYADGGFAKGFDFAATPLSSNQLTSSKTIYGKWDVSYYTLHFYRNDGTIMPDGTGTLAFKRQVGALSNTRRPRKADEPTRGDDYRFEDWFASATTTTTPHSPTLPCDPTTPRFCFGSRITGPTDVYAKWVRRYEVTYFDDSATIVSDLVHSPKVARVTGLPPAQRVDTGATVAAPTTSPTVGAPTGVPQREHFTFEKWWDTTNNEEFKFTEKAITSDTTVYAKWKRKRYRVYYYKKGLTDREIKMVNSGAKPSPLDPEPTWSETVGRWQGGSVYSHKFVGWYEDKPLTSRFNFANTAITDHETEIYGGWEPAFMAATDIYYCVADRTFYVSDRHALLGMDTAGNRRFVSRAGTRGTGPAFGGEGKLGEIVGHNGKIYVTDSSSGGRLMEVDPATGDRKIFASGLGDIQGLTVGLDDNGMNRFFVGIESPAAIKTVDPSDGTVHDFMDQTALATAGGGPNSLAYGHEVDDRYLYLSVHGSGVSKVKIVGKSVEKLWNPDKDDVGIYYDGTHLYTASKDRGKGGVYKMNVATGAKSKILDGNGEPWSITSHAGSLYVLYFIGPPDAKPSIVYKVDPNTGAIQKKFKNIGDAGNLP